MDIFWAGCLGILLTATLAFHFQPDRSRYEIDRLAKNNAKYKKLAQFLDIYPGALVLARFKALIIALILTILSSAVWGIWAGGGVAFLVIILSIFLAQAFRSPAQNLIIKHLDFFIKYNRMVKPLGQLIVRKDEPGVSSEIEMIHLIETGNFLDDQTKNLVKSVMAFTDKTAGQIMTPRDNLTFVHSRDALTPVLIDELFSSGHRLFPVARGGIDQVIGFLLLDDVLPIDQEEKILTKIMRKSPPAVDAETPLESALKQMCEYRVSALMVTDDDKTVGMVTLHDIVRELFKEGS